ncbi:MAG: Uncharacterized MFS-type transporter, partial [uncultured Quadrisphaera sp.]
DRRARRRPAGGAALARLPRGPGGQPGRGVGAVRGAQLAGAPLRHRGAGPDRRVGGGRAARRLPRAGPRPAARRPAGRHLGAAPVAGARHGGGHRVGGGAGAAAHPRRVPGLHGRLRAGRLAAGQRAVVDRRRHLPRPQRPHRGRLPDGLRPGGHRRPPCGGVADRRGLLPGGVRGQRGGARRRAGRGAGGAEGPEPPARPGRTGL